MSLSLNLKPAPVHAAQNHTVDVALLSVRTKKLIVTIVIIVWVPIYALIAARIGVSVLPDADPVVEFLYYAVAGTAWIVPIGLMFPWMNREPRP